MATAKEIVGQIQKIWETRIADSKKDKAALFGNTANKLWGFMAKPYTELYGLGRGNVDISNVNYKPRVNLAAELCDVMIPYIGGQQHRLASPRRPALTDEIATALPAAAAYRQQIDPADKLRAWMMTWMLNYTSGEFGLSRELLLALPEALVKGRGLFWCEMVESAAGFIPASSYVSVDDLLLDPGTTVWRDGDYIIRIRPDQPIWRVAEEFGVNPAKLRGAAQKTNRSGAALDGERDTVTYYEVWSRSGLGQNAADLPDSLKDLKPAFDAVGPYVWLVLVEGMEAPLNLPASQLDMTINTIEDIRDAVEWPLRLYEDFANPWPCTPLDFHPDGDTAWAASTAGRGLAQMVFVDHVHAWLVGRFRIASRRMYVVHPSLEDAVKKMIVFGSDQEVAFRAAANDAGVPVDKMIEVIEFPDASVEAWNILDLNLRQFQRATGLDPKLYGDQGGEGQTQIRSATEAEDLLANVKSRPNEMRERVRQFLSGAAAKESQVFRMHGQPGTVARIVGEPDPVPTDPLQPAPQAGPLTMAWFALLYTDDPALASAELSFTTEAGDADVKNRQDQQADLRVLVEDLKELRIIGLNTGWWEPYNAGIDDLGTLLGRDLSKRKFPNMRSPASAEGEPPQPPSIPVTK